MANATTPLRDSYSGNLITSGQYLRADSTGNLENTGDNWLNVDVSDTHVVDLSNATGATINELRKASAF